MARSYVSGDYAGIESKNLKAYYGCEVLENDEWCFKAEYNGNVTVIPFSELKMPFYDMFEVQEALIHGIALMFDKLEIRKVD